MKQRLLLYGAHSQLNHTHCLTALSPAAISEVDSILEETSRKIWHLPNTFPQAGIHAPSEDLGLNIPTVWVDYCRAAIKSWTKILTHERALGVNLQGHLYTSRIEIQTLPPRASIPPPQRPRHVPIGHWQERSHATHSGFTSHKSRGNLVRQPDTGLYHN